MIPRIIPGILLLVFVAAAFFPAPEPASACAPAPPRDKQVAIANESAIIIWDEAGKTQHFIRRASFNTDAKDFGFLVPTPTKPELAEAGDEAFATLAQITAPRVITKSRPAPGVSCGCGGKPSSGRADKANAEPAGVRVLEEKRVAGHDAAVLEADDADALSKWLKEHGYEFSPALTDWVKPYVKAGWKVTAFKIAKDAPESKSVGTSAVRMTFKTERPFFPYREPENQGKDGAGPMTRRLLRVYFLADNRVKGTLDKDGKAWDAIVFWANRLDAANRDKLLQLLKLPAQTPPASWWLTEFEDHASLRPGGVDVYFARSEDQSTVEREPVIQYVSAALPGCVMCYALAAYMLITSLVRHWPRFHNSPPA